jgi:hypothetical protein
MQRMQSLLTPTHETAGAAGIELRGLVRSFASPAAAPAPSVVSISAS